MGSWSLCNCKPEIDQVLVNIQKMDTAMPPDQPDQLLNLAVKSVHTGATTIMECGITMALKLSGIQKQRYLANLAVDFHKHVKDIGSSRPPAPSELVFPALYNVMRSTASTT